MSFSCILNYINYIIDIIFNYIHVDFNIINVYDIHRKEVLSMASDDFPAWLHGLDEEDFEFMRQFILCSGSLKNMAQHYEVSYPTIRLRIDRLIQKVSGIKSEEDQFITLIKDIALDGEISYETAKKLISSYKKTERRQAL